MLLLKITEEMVLSVQRLSQYKTSARIFKTRQMLCVILAKWHTICLHCHMQYSFFPIQTTGGRGFFCEYRGVQEKKKKERPQGPVYSRN